LNELLLRELCMLLRSDNSERLDCESNEENFGDRFILGSAWLLMTFTDWNWGILGRAPVELKELVVADFDGVDDETLFESRCCWFPLTIVALF
jgi:hypothetical protein